MGIRKLEGQKKRVETGVTQFGDDWPGLFIRGDQCFEYYLALDKNLKILESSIKKEEGKSHFFDIIILKSLRDSLKETIVDPSFLKEKSDETGNIGSNRQTDNTD